VTPMTDFPAADDCYYCGAHTPNPSPTNLCPQRAGELPHIPRRLLRGSTPEVRAALQQLGLDQEGPS
jgi:hypothetical protein